MSTGYGYTHPDLPETALRDLVASQCGSPTFLYYQAADALRLMRLEGREAMPPLAPEGRAFGPRAEVRWQRRGEGAGRYVVLVLSEVPLDLGSDWSEEAFEASEPTKIYLMGAWHPAERAWIEVSIPHPLDYPLSGPASNQMARPVAPAIEYCREGMVRYIRFTGLMAEPLEEARR